MKGFEQLFARRYRNESGLEETKELMLLIEDISAGEREREMYISIRQRERNRRLAERTHVCIPSVLSHGSASPTLTSEKER